MKKHTPVTQIMSTQLILAHEGMKVSDVRKLMEKHTIHHVPVVSGKKLLGLISAVSILKASFSSALVNTADSDELLDHTISLEGVTETNVMTIKSTDTIKQATELLCISDHDSLLVVDEQHELQGIITVKDLMKYLLDQF